MDIKRQGQLVEVLGSEMSNKYSVNTIDSSANTKTHSFDGRFLISEPVVKFFHDGRKLEISPNKDEDPYAAIARYVFELNDEIEKLKSELAKAQAVPEGFALVKKVHPDAIVHNQGLGLFKECQIIYGWDGKSKDFKDALNKGFYHGVKLGAKAVLETAMIEAQEPAND